jgi:Ribbon-helix-helix protein, copG family
MKTPKPLKPAGLRLAEETLAELAVRAEAEQRSVGFLIRRYIREGLERAERLDAAAKARKSKR